MNLAEGDQKFDLHGFKRPVGALATYYLIISLAALPLFPIVWLFRMFKYWTLEYDFDDEGLDCLVKNGFMAPEQGEDKKDTGKRIAEFIKKRKQEDLQRTEESRKSQAVLKVIKAGKKTKSSAAK